MKRWLPFGFGFIVFLFAGFYVFSGPLERGLRQPIAFNHKKHIENGLECTDCHQYVEEYAFAGVPEVDVCLTCHEEAMTESPEEEKIREYARRGERIPWARLFRQPGHVYFSHRLHVVLAKLECTTCHGDIAETQKPPPKPGVELDMDNCMSCHQAMKADLDCNACHK